MMKQQLVTMLTTILGEMGVTDVVPAVEYPADPLHGDYASNISLIVAKKLGKNPRELAEEIVKKLDATSSALIAKAEVAGPGFINIWIKQEVLAQLVSEQQLSDIGKGRTIVIEYSSPNIAKPFTIGHLRSTIIGDAIANLLKATGWNVKRDNHIGDWGTQFGKQIYAIKNIRLPYITYSEGENIGNRNEQEIENSPRPVKVLVDLYVQFHEQAKDNPEMEEKAREWFKKLEDGDTEARSLWNACIDWSWKEFNEIYRQLDVTFTENKGQGYGESFFEDKMDSVIDELNNKKLLETGKEGAKIVAFADETKLPPLMILKKDGATLYATRDLATDKFRLKEYGNDVVIINEVGAEQSLYFRQLYQLEETLGWFTKDQRIHIKHGLYRFKEGKMSTRKGNVIWLEDVLEEAKQRALFLKSNKQEKPTKLTAAAALERTSLEKRDGVISAKDHFENVEPIAIGAIKWNDLKRNPEQDIAFDWDEILNMQGNSGPYLQYTYVRTQSVLKKAGEKTEATLPATLASEERMLLKFLARYPEIVVDAATRYAPNVLCSYLFELAQAFNGFYQKHQIVKAPSENRAFRVALTASVGKTLQSGLLLLGIKAPEKM